jgi:hypothetical protein
MKFFKKNLSKVILIIYVVLLPIITFAQTGGNSSTGGNSGCDPSKGLCNPLGTTSTLPELIQTVLQGALKIGIPLIALAIIYSGFLFVFARGNSEKLTDAKKSLLYTIIGAAILLGSWAIAEMISITVTGLGK